MDSETKMSRTEEAERRSVLNYIREKLRPMLLKKWRTSRATALASAASGGMTEAERDLFLAGHRTGYWQGAVDAAEIKPADLRPDQDRDRDPHPPRGKVH